MALGIIGMSGVLCLATIGSGLVQVDSEIPLTNSSLINAYSAVFQEFSITKHISWIFFSTLWVLSTLNSSTIIEIILGFLQETFDHFRFNTNIDKSKLYIALSMALLAASFTLFSFPPNEVSNLLTSLTPLALISTVLLSR